MIFFAQIRLTGMLAGVLIFFDTKNDQFDIFPNTSPQSADAIVKQKMNNEPRYRENKIHPIHIVADKYKLEFSSLLNLL